MSINQLPKGLVEATKEVLEGSAEYQAFFKKALKKFGVDSPAELGDKKKEKEEEEQVDEWIKADGTRRRVAEKDQRKVKVEDVVRDMWKNATEV